MGLAAAPGAATAGAAAAPVSAGVPAAGDSPGMAPFAAKRVPSPARAKRFFYFHPPIPPTPPPPTYLLRGPLGRSKPDLPTYCIGSNGSQQTPYLARSRNPGRSLPSLATTRLLRNPPQVCVLKWLCGFAPPPGPPPRRVTGVRSCGLRRATCGVCVWPLRGGTAHRVAKAMCGRRRGPPPALVRKKPSRMRVSKRLLAVPQTGSLE